jgi:parvulin-like peptidyl-prolyl isomerase
MRKIFGWIKPLALLAVLLLAAPGRAEPNKAEPNSPPKQPPRPGAVVTINNVDITESQVQAAIKAEFEKRAKQKEDLPPTSAVELVKEVRQQVLRRMILEHLLLLEVELQKIELTKEDVLANLKARGAKQNPPLSIEQIKQKIEAGGKTFDQALRQMQQNKRWRFQKLMNAHLEGKIDITDRRANEFYTMNKQQFEIPEQVKTSHILIKSAANDADCAKAKAKAQRLLKRAKAGDDFATLAKKHSDDPLTAAKGGDRGFAPRGVWAEPFDEVVFQLKTGQLSNLVETPEGYHIIKITDRIEADVISFEEAKQGIIDQLTESKRQQLVTRYIRSLKDKAEVVYHDETFPNRLKITIRPPGHDPNHDPNHDHGAHKPKSQ